MNCLTGLQTHCLVSQASQKAKTLHDLPLINPQSVRVDSDPADALMRHIGQ
jgi:hypothetical protein